MLGQMGKPKLTTTP